MVLLLQYIGFLGQHVTLCHESVRYVTLIDHALRESKKKQVTAKHQDAEEDSRNGRYQRSFPGLVGNDIGLALSIGELEDLRNMNRRRSRGYGVYCDGDYLRCANRRKLSGDEETTVAWQQHCGSII